MLKIGVTGNIGSGKSQVCRIFELLGIPVYYADEKAKELMINNKDLVSSIKTLIGTESYFSDGGLNTAFISERIFKDKSLLEQLNAWVHPAVAFDFMDWCLAQQSQYVIKEAALLYESGSYKDLDEIIMVTAPEKLRIQRVIGRDGMTEKQVLMRIRNQMDEKLKIEKADYIIRNDGDAFLVRQILKLHNHFLNQSF
mgnify:CR=1 FL=1